MTLKYDFPLPSDAKEKCELFFKNTDDYNIGQYAKGKSLSKLVEQAEAVIQVIDKNNPIWDSWNGPQTDSATFEKAKQWQIDRISEVKQKLAVAIVYKQRYYENHWFGKITKFFLKLFCVWNEGNTTSIRRAEDFLLFWDSRVPVQLEKGKYLFRHFFFPLTMTDWVQTKLNTSNFFNYTLPRTIEVYDAYRDMKPEAYKKYNFCLVRTPAN